MDCFNVKQQKKLKCRRFFVFLFLSSFVADNDNKIVGKLHSSIAHRICLSIYVEIARIGWTS